MPFALKGRVKEEPFVTREVPIDDFPYAKLPVPTSGNGYIKQRFDYQNAVLYWEVTWPTFTSTTASIPITLSKHDA